jgi:hypothetical protein
MHRTKRTNVRPATVAGVVVVLGLAVWGLTKLLAPVHAAGDPPSHVAASPPSSPPIVETSLNSGKLLGTDTPAPKPAADPPPLSLRQGRGSGSEEQSQTAKPQPALGHPAGAPQPTASAPIASAPVGDPAPPGAPESSGGASPKATPPPAPAPVITPDPVPASATSPALAAARLKESTDPLAARLLYSQALRDPSTSPADQASIRDAAAKLNADLVFSSRVAPGDPFAESYTVQSGDNLTVIARKLGLATDRRLIARINAMPDEHRVTVGQKLKIVKGPFHAVVSKSAFRLDLYMGPADKPDQWVFVRSFKVGLGEQGSTPAGTFIVKRGSKLVDPPWINPHTGEKFGGHDPKNPIGKFWVGLEGTGEAAQYTGYGIHGTIDPDSVGQMKSMGCVRMLADDIALVWELLGEQVSVVKIQP